MPTQKVFKQRVRARMTKTGESYTAARAQLLHKVASDEVAPPSADEPVAPQSANVTPEPLAPPALTDEEVLGPDHAPDVADDAVVRATGHGYAHWFRLLDAWGGTQHSHPEIARWLSSEHDVPPWWTQGVTVAYERARRLRGRHQMVDGYSVSVTRTVDSTPEAALRAFTDATLRARWLPEPVTQRRTTAATTARFDWPEPPGRLVVTVTPKDQARTVVGVSLEKLPDADAAARAKALLKVRLDALRSLLAERPDA